VVWEKVALLAILKKMKFKLAVDPARREPQERLGLEYAASVGQVAAVDERLKLMGRE
jgi:hypothetical protein